VSEYIRMIHCC